jgi:hypothetical protein
MRMGGCAPLVFAPLLVRSPSPDGAGLEVYSFKNLRVDFGFRCPGGAAVWVCRKLAEETKSQSQEPI